VDPPSLYTDQLADTRIETHITGAVAGPLFHSENPSVGSVSASGTHQEEDLPNKEGPDRSRYLTIKFNTIKGTSSGKFRPHLWMKIANLLLTIDLEGFVKAFNEASGADHAASPPENSRMGELSAPAELSPIKPFPVVSTSSDTELLAALPGAVSLTSVSSSNPLMLPDFDWRSQPSLMVELIEEDLTLEGPG
jgi:hypothetical protein